MLAQSDFELHQMDVDTELLNGELDDNVNMDVSQRATETDRKSTVCKPLKALHGL